MEIIIFETEAYYKMVDELKRTVIEATKRASEKEREWLSALEAKIILGVKSKSKMQQLRDCGEIVFSQHGRIIKYSKSSLIAFLERNTIK